MTTGIDQHVLRVVNDLAVEFNGSLARPAVLEVVLRACLDLQGQIAPEAASEMLYRLARHRLLETTGGQRSSAGSSSRRR
jgi:hypothetical protein